MKVTERDGVTIIRPRGQISVKESQSLKRKAEELIKEGHLSILLDLSKVTFMDSSGFGTVAIIKTKIRMRRGRFGVFGLNEKLNRLFEMTRLSDILRIFTTEDEGIQVLKEEISTAENHP